MNALVEVEEQNKTKKQHTNDEAKEEQFDDEMTTIFDNTDCDEKREQIVDKQSKEENDKSKWNERISAALSVIDTLHSELNACEQSLESKNLIFGKLLAQKSKLEKE